MASLCLSVVRDRHKKYWIWVTIREKVCRKVQSAEEVFKAFLNDSAINVTIVQRKKVASALFLKGFEDSLCVIIWYIKINATLYGVATAMSLENRL